MRTTNQELRAKKDPNVKSMCVCVIAEGVATGLYTKRPSVLTENPKKGG